MGKVLNIKKSLSLIIHLNYFCCSSVVFMLFNVKSERYILPKISCCFDQCMWSPQLHYVTTTCLGIQKIYTHNYHAICIHEYELLLHYKYATVIGLCT